MEVREFDFELPADLIAQEPAAERGGARLLCLNRKTAARTHTFISALPELLSAGDLVVVNNTRVVPARLLGKRIPTGGSIAAPTAGLHFSSTLVAALAERGVDVAEITLHVGYGTFQPLHVEQVEDARLHPEHYEISERASALVNRALIERRRVIAVGT